MEILKKFGLDISIYQDYQTKKNEYEKELNEYLKKINVLESHSFINFIFGAVWLSIVYKTVEAIVHFFRLDIVSLNELLSILLCYFFIFLIVYPIHLFSSSKETHNFLSNGKYFELLAKKEELEEKFFKLTNELKQQVGNKEKALKDYCEKQIEDFKNEKLFRKNSGTVDFQESLSNYALMIERLSKLSNMLIVERFNLWEDKAYLENRKKNIEESKIFHNQRIGKSEKEIKDAFETETKQKIKTLIVSPEVEYQKSKKVNSAKLPSSFIGRKIDWKTLSESQRLTGESGEELVFELEKDYLCEKGRSDLAERVCRMSKEKGDGLGYDVLSFFVDGKEKYIEVKSTTLAIESSFYMSKNELSFLESHKDDSYVYRVALAKDVGNNLLQVIPSNDFLANSERTPIMFRVQM